MPWEFITTRQFISRADLHKEESYVTEKLLAPSWGGTASFSARRQAKIKIGKWRSRAKRIGGERKLLPFRWGGAISGSSGSVPLK